MDDKKKIQEAIVQEHGVSDDALEGVAGGCDYKPGKCPKDVLYGGWPEPHGCGSTNISVTYKGTGKFYDSGWAKDMNTTWWWCTCNNCGLEWTRAHMKGTTRHEDYARHIDSIGYSPDR